MKDVAEDRLLRVARLLIRLVMGISLLIAAGALLSIPVIFAKQHEFAAELIGNGFEPSAIWWGALLLALVFGCAALAFLFLRQLAAIVQSASQGDPFVPVNAGRLRNMGWLALAIQLVAVPMTRLAVWFDAAPFPPNVHHNENGISVGGLILVLILFVLARVFREGARLREEVEGTI